MTKPILPLTSASAPHDQAERQRALDPSRSILVQAPAGSGKTDLLTRRFLRLLAQVDDPGQIVAITFTKAAAAEMRNRILSELEKASQSNASSDDPDVFSMPALAARALEQSRLRAWKLLDLPNQLRISTIDSFCRELALQQPLLSGLGGSLDVAAEPSDLYRRAARHTLNEIGKPNSTVSAAIESLLIWRDNNWQELETLLVEMLSKRDRWMHDFVLSPDPDWDHLRARLERPFANAVRHALTAVGELLDQSPGARDEALFLARFACSNPGGDVYRTLAELVDFPTAPFLSHADLEHAHQSLLCFANLVLTNDCKFRRAVDKRLGFPADRKPEKARILDLICQLDAIPGFESALAAVRDLPPARYTDEDWNIVRACFTLLRHAAAQLRVDFAESGSVDFVEVAQIAQTILHSEDGFPTDAALSLADGIRHLLVDEFQDTSRRQHQLLAGLVAAWPGISDDARTCFLVGDPMQSIYLFREADPELFPRVREKGLDLPNAEPLAFDCVSLSSNFRTTPRLVQRLNRFFKQIFAVNDDSGVIFDPAQPARHEQLDTAGLPEAFNLHVNFAPQAKQTNIVPSHSSKSDDPSLTAQSDQIIALVRSHQPAMDAARAGGTKHRIAVLARTRSALVPIAKALRDAKIPMRAVELERLSSRPEILDALALAGALLNAHDRVAWLGVLRAPWCGLALQDLHILTSADQANLKTRPIPELLAERLPLISDPGRFAAARVLIALTSPADGPAQPTASTGTWLRQTWLRLGGVHCYDATSLANLDQLWVCLDGLPNGQLDILGPALAKALDKLTALPDTDASSEVGVQLMTIHKSKGLEFEVVIVPELQAKTGRGSLKLLSWLERGLAANSDADADEAEIDGEVTEFLVAPLQPKGDDRGKSKSWVDRVYNTRESQETRRILYVAATRAREELHLFARPRYKVDATGEFTLVEPKSSLLATAWPALEEQVTARFNAWKTTANAPNNTTDQASTAAFEPSSDIDSLAASASGNLFIVPLNAESNAPSITPSPARPTMLRRLPANYLLPNSDFSSTPSIGQAPATSEPTPAKLYPRHEGGLASRALGTAVHSYLEQLAELRKTKDWQAARTLLSKSEARISLQARSVGLDRNKSDSIAAEALQLALTASDDPIAQWILSPQADAASEVCWTGFAGDTISTVRIDRIFRAGLEPRAESQQAWWIIDYKTHAKTSSINLADELQNLRASFEPQLVLYANVLRNLHGEEIIIRAGLYYPRMQAFDWWEL